MLRQIDRSKASKPDLLPDSFVQEVRDRASIRSVVEPYVTLRKSGASLVGLCPFHKEKSPSFSVSEEKGFYHCFGCGENGDAINFLTKFAGQTFREAVEELAGSVGMTLPVAATTAVAQDFSGLHKKMDLAFKFYRHCLKHTDTTKDYLKKRGVNAESVNNYGLCYAPQGWQSLSEAFGDAGYKNDPDLVSTSLVREKDGRRYDVFRDRLLFPIRDRRGRIIGFGGRALDDSEPKYLNSPESELFDKGTVLYGFHEARSAILAEKAVIVVEGYMDVVMLAQYGIQNVVATMGTACTPVQMERLCAVAPVAIFTFDNDSAGHRAAWRALENCLPFLTEQHEFRFCIVSGGKDPDEIVRAEGSEGFRKQVAGAQGLVEFMMNSLAAKHAGLATPEDQARFLAEGRDLLRRLPSGSPYFRIMRDELVKVSKVGSTNLVLNRKEGKRSAVKYEIWQSLLAAVRRFPTAAKGMIELVVDSLSAEDLELLESESFASEHEKQFWEYFLALVDGSDAPDAEPETPEDLSNRDLVLSLVRVLEQQLTLQRRWRLSTQYRKGDLSETEFIDAKSRLLRSA